MRNRMARHAAWTQRYKTVWLLPIAIGLVGAGAAWAYQIQRAEEPPANQDQPVATETQSAETKYNSVMGRYLFTGTIVPARGVEQQAMRADGSYDYAQPFSQLDTLEPEKYDAWLTDLECPITDANMTFRQQVETLIFNCRTGFLGPIVEYFEFINLANNHSGDQGREAFIQTQQQLNAAGAQTFGHYDPAETDDTCEIVGLPARLIGKDSQETLARFPVAMCAWHYFTKSPQQQELDVMNQYVDALPVFAFTHAGMEYVPTAQAPEVELARSIIDRGAEFVINNNPHWVQNTEVYDDRLIVYSTGNFMFDQLDEETNRAANLDITIEVEYSDTIAQWLELGDQCLTRNDNCLDIIIESGLTKPTINYTFDVVASLNGYRALTRKADPTTQAAVEARMNWSETLSQLGQE